MSRKISEDITGKNFGRLAVIRMVGQDIGRETKWLCQCECGKTSTPTAGRLLRGRAKSCGCLVREKTREARTTHGESRKRLNKIWYSMRQRCTNPNCVEYHNYGGRGIKVCEEWETNYLAFRDWARENGYADSLSIDRINNDGNYEPNNCRWATKKEQSRNTRRTRLITYESETHCITEWAEIFGVKPMSLTSTLRYNQYDPEKVFYRYKRRD